MTEEELYRLARISEESTETEIRKIFGECGNFITTILAEEVGNGGKNVGALKSIQKVLFFGEKNFSYQKGEQK